MAEKKLRGLLDRAQATIGGLLGDFPQGFNAGAVAGVAGYPGDIAYMLDTAGRAITGQDTQPAAQDFPGTTDYIAAKAGYPIPGSFSGQLGAAVGGLMTPGPGDLAKFAPVLSAIPFWHGSPHKYDAVDLSKIGTGEGAQVYGWGYYGAQAKDTAEAYQNALSAPEFYIGNNKADPFIGADEATALALSRIFSSDAVMHTGKLNAEHFDKARRALEDESIYLGNEKLSKLASDAAEKIDGLKSQFLDSSAEFRMGGNMYRGEYRWPDPAKEAATPLTGDDLLDWDKPLSEQPGLKSYLSQSLGDVGPGNANNGGAFSKGSSAPAHIGSNRDVPLNPVVGNRVGGMLDNGKVGNSVVGLVPVDVVDALAGKQLSAEVGLHNQAMNLALPSVNGGNGVPLGVNSASSPVGGVALPSLAEGSRVSGDVVGVPVNTLSAIRAGDFDKATGHDLYRAISDELGSDKAATNYLTSRSVLGIRYLDQMSRPFQNATTRVTEDAGKWFGTVNTPRTDTHNSSVQVSDYFDTKAEADAWVKKTLGEPTRNYVMFDDKGIKLLERNGEPLKAAEDFAARRAGKAKPYKEAVGVDGPMRLPDNALMGTAEFKVKPPKRLFRGVGEGGSTTGTYALGKGLYTSRDKSFAAMYGEVSEVSPDDAWPRNPLVLNQVAGGAPGAFADWALKTSGLKNMREFNKLYADPGEFVRSLGYDGVIAGDEVVRYPIGH